MALMVFSVHNIVFCFIIWLVVCGGTYLAISYFLISDYLQSKTDKTLFYVNEHGRKYPTDNIRIFLNSFLSPFLVVEFAYLFGHMFQTDGVILFGTVYGILTIYITILIYLRKTYFPFIDEEKEIWKRKTFKDYEKNIYDIHFLDAHRDEFYGDKFIWDYLGVNFANIIFNAILSMFISYIIVFEVWYLVYGIMPLIIFMHLTLFPDYINKILPNDIRTHEGFRIYHAIWGFLLFIAIFSLKLIAP